jgi:hypothetical protein
MIFGNFQFKFKDRVTAAGILGESLKDKVKSEERRNTVVIGIPRGGHECGIDKNDMKKYLLYKKRETDWALNQLSNDNPFSGPSGF